MSWMNPKNVKLRSAVYERFKGKLADYAAKGKWSLRQNTIPHFIYWLIRGHFSTGCAKYNCTWGRHIKTINRCRVPKLGV